MLIDCFIIQTDSRWNLHIIYDGPAPKEIQEVIGLYNDCRINFYCSAQRNGNYGHPNRRRVLDKLAGEPGDFVLMTNDDNVYVPVFVEMMMQNATRLVGIVSCNTVHSHFQYRVHESRLVENGIDMGAFIVKYEIAKAIGFKYDDFSADGKYAEECANACRCASMDMVHIDKPYFVHN
jgi:hypothetical protein